MSGVRSAAAVVDALIRASTTADDPALRVAGALADDPFLQDWAASEALRVLGAPRDPAEPSGRLAVFALGRDADAMARGAVGVFGRAVDEGIVAVPKAASPVDPVDVPSGVVRYEGRPAAAGAHLEALARDLGGTDRALILVSPGSEISAALPLGSLDVGDLDALCGVVRAAGWSAGRTAALRSRLDGLRGGGLLARIEPASLRGLRIAGEGADADPLGAAPPSGRSLEIELRAGGISLPDRVVAVLRSPDTEHAGWGRESRGAVDVRTLDDRGGGLSAAVAAARRRGLSVTVLTDRLQGTPEAAGRGLARVAAALEGGLGEVDLPACALAAGRTDGAPDRHERLGRAADRLLEGRRGATVAAWTPRAGGVDLYAAVVLAPPDA